MKREAIAHTEMKRLCRRMDIPLWQGVGLLEMIWQLTAREAPWGDIGKLSDEEIAIGIDYRGDESKLIEALVQVGWLDRDPVERLVVHQWHEHCEAAVHMRLARARLHFVCGYAPKWESCRLKNARCSLDITIRGQSPPGLRHAHKMRIHAHWICRAVARRTDYLPPDLHQSR